MAEAGGYGLDLFMVRPKPKYEPGAPRPHCSKCGRFARYIPGSSGPDYWGEYDCGTVVCKEHGEQDASWGPV